ncbi:flagellar basal-body MS-ring/collar protein FliF [Hydrogenophaga sp. 5NK40-0174]|uniref:flagellar basal-body MS-ring/collar protein FliF n=1 Tax=Hydrogenophaga sp. 5NK40-0174 TaxID=3127649 RepID=UPI003106874D
MSTTLAETPVTPQVTPPRNALTAGFSRLSNAQKLRLGGGVLAMFILALAAFFMTREPQWRVLYSNLSDKDGGAIVAQLTQMNVQYKHSDSGQSIMVPADRVHDVRLRLASQGLPKGSVAGFELMENNRFGMTQFQERLTFQRGLEGELTRSIQSLSSVEAARVHLALPNQNGFFRAQQKPSASVLLTLHPGRSLDKAQVAGIIHLVASSVPEMNPKAVSVVDEGGNLLSASPDANAQTADVKKLQYTQQIEQLYTRRILDMIEPLVGVGNVKAQVSALVDFSEVESTSEQHRPNQGGEPGTIRSQQIVEDGTAPQAQPAGVPGAVTNQPPETGTAPINGDAAPVGAGQTSETAGKTRRESVTNYEVDKTVRVVRESSGNVKRLTAAVVVNNRTTLDKNGKETSTAIPQEQLDKMAALVRETIGFSQERGDSVNVVNAEFNVVKEEEPEPIAWYQAPDNVALAKDMAMPASLIAIGLLIFMGLVRPMLKLIKAPAPVEKSPEVSQISAIVNDSPERPGLPQPAQEEASTDLMSPEEARMADARRLAIENPMAVANIVKGWVNGEVPA